MFLFLFLVEFTYSQTMVNEKIYFSETKDSVDVKVWLPKDYSKEKAYPVLYEFAYDHTNFISATLDNYYRIPEIIVVYAKVVSGNSHYRH